MGRLSLTVAISGGSKSLFLKIGEDVYKSEVVKQAFAVATETFCKKLAVDFDADDSEQMSDLFAKMKTTRLLAQRVA